MSLDDSQPGMDGCSFADWREIKETLRKTKPALAAVLDHGLPIAVGPDRLTIAFAPGSFFALQARAPGAIEAIEATARQVMGQCALVEVRS